MNPGLILLAGLIFGLVISGLAALQNSLLILAVPLLFYLTAAVYRRPEEPLLTVRRSMSPDHAPQGAPIQVRLSVTNAGPRPVDELVVAESVPAGFCKVAGETAAAALLAPGASLELSYLIQAVRGQYQHYGVNITASDPAGFFTFSSVLQPESHLVVYPRYPKLERLKAHPPQTRGFAGPIASRQGGTGIDFYGVREYQSGDPQRHINWKVAARNERELFTNVFEQERVADIGLILDARQLVEVSSPAGSLFEHSVQAAASLAENFLSDGNRVSLMVYGGGIDSVIPGYGRIQKDHILKSLARTKPGMNYALDRLDYLPTRFFPAGSQVVLISPVSPGDVPVIIQMRMRGYAVMVISPDPVAFAAALHNDRSSLPYRMAFAERDFMLQRLRRSGAQVVNWQVDQPFEGVVRSTLARQPVIHRQIGVGL